MIQVEESGGALHGDGSGFDQVGGFGGGADLENGVGFGKAFMMMSEC